MQKYLSTTAHAYDVLVLIVSKKFWDRLGDTDRAALAEAAGEATAHQRTRLQPVIDKYTAQLGEPLVNGFHGAIAQARRIP